MQKINLFGLAMMLFLLSCKSSVTTVGVKPTNNTIEGDLQEYFTIVEGDYKVEKGDGYGKDWKISVQLERNDKPFAFKKEDLDNYLSNENNIELDLVDEKGDPILYLDDFTPDSWTDVIEAKSGEKIWVTFHKRFVADEELKQALPDNITGFTINSSFQDTEKPEQTADNSTDEEESESDEESSSLSSSEKSQWIDDYEKFIDDYIALMDKQMKFTKKAQDGDMSAMSEGASIMQEAVDIQTQAQELSEKIESNKDDFSSSDMRKFTRIQAKMTKAALKMQTQMLN